MKQTETVRIYQMIKEWDTKHSCLSNKQHIVLISHYDVNCISMHCNAKFPFVIGFKVNLNAQHLIAYNKYTYWLQLTQKSKLVMIGSQAYVVKKFKSSPHKE